MGFRESHHNDDQLLLAANQVFDSFTNLYEGEVSMPESSHSTIDPQEQQDTVPSGGDRNNFGEITFGEAVRVWLRIAMLSLAVLPPNRRHASYSGG